MDKNIMATQPAPTGYTRTLRLVPIVAFLYSLALSIPYAVAFNHLVPAIGLIFLAGSVVQSLVVLRCIRAIRRALLGRKHEYRIVLGDNNEHRKEGFRKVALSTLLILSDATLAFTHACLFAFTLVDMTCGYHGWNDHSDILGTFASLAYLAAFFAHTALAIKGIYSLSTDIRFSDLTHCPHCHVSVFAGRTNSQSETTATTPRVRSEPGTPAGPDSNSPKMTGAWSEAAGGGETLMNTEA